MILKKSKLAVMLVLSMLGTMFMGASTVTAAELSVVGTADVVRNNDTFQKLATIQVDLPLLEGEGVQNDGKTKEHVVLVTLPEKFAIDFSDSDMLKDSNKNPRGLLKSCPEVTVVKNKMGSGNITLPAGTQGAKNAGVERVNDREFKIHLRADVNDTDVRLLVTLPAVFVPSSFTGQVPVEFSNISGAFDKKAVIKLNEVDTGAASVDASVFATADIAKDKPGRVVINLQEKTDRAFALGRTMVLKLPDGLVWEEPSIKNLAVATSNLKSIVESGDASRLIVQRIMTGNPKSLYRLQAGIKVADVNKAVPGAISATILGDANVEQETLLLGTFSDYSDGKGVQVTAALNAPDILAGKLAQPAADIIIENKISNALLDNVDIKVTLPENAKWYNVNVSADGGIQIVSREVIDNGRVFVLRVKTGGSLGKIKLQNLQVMTAGDFTGSLKAEVAGAGIKSQNVTIASVHGLKGDMEAVKTVTAGVLDQQISVMQLEEVAPEVLAKGNLYVELPKGVTWAKTPTVSVFKGDVDLDENNIVARGQVLTIPVKTASAQPSTLKMTGIILNLDRTVPAGDIKVKVYGDAVDKVNYQTPKTSVGKTDGVSSDDKGQLFPKNTEILNLTIARNGAPLPVAPDTRFVIGSQTYTVNGETKTMDVAPYIKNDRTYMPVRYIANAIGINDDNIKWDDQTRTATLQQSGKTVQMTIYSTDLVVDGVKTAIDVAPEITSSRTMLPARFVAEAFGYTVGWNPSIQAVTLSKVTGPIVVMP